MERELSNFVPGLSEVVTDLEDSIAGRNETLQFQDEGVDVATKGGINTVNFTGAGVTAAEGALGVLDVTIPGGGGGGSGNNYFPGGWV